MSEPGSASRSVVRVLLVEDHALMREALTGVLATDCDFEVVGQANNGVAGVEAAMRLRPDLVLVDNCMPRLVGVEATRQIAQALPATKVIGLSLDESQEHQ